MSSPDEYRYGEIPREMLHSGDWVVPRLDGMPYFEKPIWGYWMIAASMKVFGLTAFAIRLPSALGVGLAALAAGLLLRRNPDSRAGPLAAAIVLTSLLSVAVGTTGVLDGVFTGLMTSSLVATYVFLEARSSRDEWLPLLLAGGAAGLAFLTKGFLALVLPAGILLPYLVMTRSLARFLRRSWIPAATFLVTVLPWSFLAASRSDFWHHFFWVEHIQRFLEPGGNQHAEPFWFFLPQILVAIIPWTVLLPAATSGLRTLEDSAARRRTLFALCWFLFPLLFFSMSSGKLVTYILPCLPPLAILLSIGVFNYLRLGARRLLSLAVTLGTALPIALLGVLVFGTMNGEPAFVRLADSGWQWGVLATGIGGWALITITAFWRRRSGVRLALLAAGPVVFFTAAQFMLDERLLRAPGWLVEAHLKNINPITPLVGDGNSVQTLCWLTRRTDVEVFDFAGEMAYGLEKSPDRDLLDTDDLVALVESSSVPVVALLERHRWDRVKQRMPEPAHEATSRKFVLVELATPSAPDHPADRPPVSKPSANIGSD